MRFSYEFRVEEDKNNSKIFRVDEKMVLTGKTIEFWPIHLRETLDMIISPMWVIVNREFFQQILVEIEVFVEYSIDMERFRKFTQRNLWLADSFV